MRYFIGIAAFFMVLSSAQAAVKVKTIAYEIDGTPFEGLFVSDTAFAGARPGILLIHDWLGVTDKTKDQAIRVARLGYRVFAADIYGKGIRPANEDEAWKTSSIYKKDRALYRKRLLAGLKQLEMMPGLKKDKIAGVGYCFGGTGVIEAARAGAPLKAVVSFHGSLDSPNPDDGKNIKGKVLALHGANDPFVPEKDVKAFEDEMRSNGVDWQLVKYGGCVHSFTDKTVGTDAKKGMAYNADADRRSWNAMREVLKEAL